MDSGDLLDNIISHFTLGSEKLLHQISDNYNLINKINNANNVTSHNDSKLDELSDNLISILSLGKNLTDLNYRSSYLEKELLHCFSNNEKFDTDSYLLYESTLNNLKLEYDYFKKNLNSSLCYPDTPDRAILDELDSEDSISEDLTLPNSTVDLDFVPLKPLRCRDAKITRKKSRYRLSSIYNINPVTPSIPINGFETTDISLDNTTTFNNNTTTVYDAEDDYGTPLTVNTTFSPVLGPAASFHCRSNSLPEVSYEESIDESICEIEDYLNLDNRQKFDLLNETDTKKAEHERTLRHFVSYDTGLSKKAPEIRKLDFIDDSFEIEDDVLDMEREDELHLHNSTTILESMENQQIPATVSSIYHPRRRNFKNPIINICTSMTKSSAISTTSLNNDYIYYNNKTVRAAIPPPISESEMDFWNLGKGFSFGASKPSQNNIKETSIRGRLHEQLEFSERIKTPKRIRQQLPEESSDDEGMLSWLSPIRKKAQATAPSISTMLSDDAQFSPMKKKIVSFLPSFVMTPTKSTDNGSRSESIHTPCKPTESSKRIPALPWSPSEIVHKPQDKRTWLLNRVKQFIPNDNKEIPTVIAVKRYSTPVRETSKIQLNSKFLKTPPHSPIVVPLTERSCETSESPKRYRTNFTKTQSIECKSRNVTDSDYNMIKGSYSKLYIINNSKVIKHGRESSFNKVVSSDFHKDDLMDALSSDLEFL